MFVMLSVSGKSMPIPTRSSRYISCVPLLSSMSMSTMSSLPSPYGMSSGRNEGGGIRCWSGECSSSGSQSSSVMIAVERSQSSSDIMLHSYGHDVPPQVRRSIISAMFRAGSCAQDWTAVLWLRWHRR